MVYYITASRALPGDTITSTAAQRGRAGTGLCCCPRVVARVRVDLHGTSGFACSRQVSECDNVVLHEEGVQAVWAPVVGLEVAYGWDGNGMVEVCDGAPVAMGG